MILPILFGRSSIYLMSKNSNAYIYSNQFKTFLKRMICQDFLPVLDSYEHLVYYVRVVFKRLVSYEALIFFSYRHMSCSPISQTISQLTFGFLSLRLYENCKTLSKFVFNHRIRIILYEYEKRKATAPMERLIISCIEITTCRRQTMFTFIFAGKMSKHSFEMSKNVRVTE